MGPIQRLFWSTSENWHDVNLHGLANLETIETHAAAAGSGPVRPVKGIPVKYRPLSFRLVLDLPTPARGGRSAHAIS